ncbi:MAG: hypothetical protein AB7S48_02340 [Bacteroidales bacterium]
MRFESRKKKYDSLNVISDNPYEVNIPTRVQTSSNSTVKPATKVVIQPSSQAEQAATRKPLPKTTSLKGIMNGTYTAPIKEESKVTDSNVSTKSEHSSITENKPFTQVDIDNAWKDFAEIIKTDKPGQYSLMQNYSPTLLDNQKILIKFEGQIQVELFQEIKTDLTIHLKKALRNLAIDISEEIETSDEPQKKRLFTADDKLKFMIEQNPALLRMKQQLNLDFN